MVKNLIPEIEDARKFLTSQKPMFDAEKYQYSCPSCNGCALPAVMIENLRIHNKIRSVSYCSECGQKLDWSEV